MAKPSPPCHLCLYMIDRKQHGEIEKLRTRERRSIPAAAVPEKNRSSPFLSCGEKGTCIPVGTHSHHYHGNQFPWFFFPAQWRAKAGGNAISFNGWNRLKQDKYRVHHAGTGPKGDGHPLNPHVAKNAYLHAEMQARAGKKLNIPPTPLHKGAFISTAVQAWSTGQGL